MRNSKRLERIKYWSQVLLLPVYWFSFFVPKSKKIWLFGSTFGRRFSDNPKYFFLYLNHQRENGIRPIWITKDKSVEHFLKEHKLEVYRSNSLKGIWFCLRGKVYIFDNYSKDISFWLSAGAIKVNLWHGSGNKKTNYDNIFDQVRHPKNWIERVKTFPRRLSDEKPNHYTLATSEAMAEITVTAFRTTMDHVLIDGYPRNDAILDRNFPNLLNREEKENLEKIIFWKKEGKIIDFYMPTFRDSEEEFFDVMNLELFNEFLVQQSIMFIVKLHPKSKLQKQFSKIEHSNIKNIDAKIDPYTFLNQVDVLTTDYSSIYTDFMLLERPVVAFHYDYESYANQTREDYIPFYEYMPEETAKTMEQLMECTAKIIKQDICLSKRNGSKRRMFQYTDSLATKRLIEKIKHIANIS